MILSDNDIALVYKHGIRKRYLKQRGKHGSGKGNEDTEVKKRGKNDFKK
jgi:hypothetical protein